MTERTKDNQEKFIKDAAQQFVNAQMEGQEPDIDEFVKKYPDYGRQIKQMILNIRKIDTLFDSLLQTDESDYEDVTDQYNLVGQKVGTFEIEEIIGRGGMGVVYLARDTKLKRSVAVKSIPAELQTSSTARTRFRREAELLASLNHPNIAVIYDIIEQDGDSDYLVLEYIEGQTLSQCLAHKPLELTEILSIGQQVAEAISAAYKKGIVHRDLKPGNIKITPDGRVKVLDFGLAKLSTIESKMDDVTVTEVGRIVGTPAYMSPEQARGKETDHRTDIWSFGCIMYQMFTGQLPFEGETATDTLARIIERQPNWDMLPQNIPANIRILLHRCLEKDMDKRLGDITEAAFEINETLSKPVITTPTKLRRMIKIISVVAIGVFLSVIAWKFIAQWGVQTSQKQVFYLRGNEYFYRGYMEDDLRNAIRLYNSAIKMDPNFALAYAQLARAYSRIYWFRYDRSEEQIARTKQAVDKAFELDPDLPEAHLALGQYYYHCHLDYDRALEQFDIARKGRPDDGEPLSMISFVKRHQGKYDEALDYIKRAYELDPLSNSIATEAGTTFFHMHMYADAERCYERAISLAPDIHHNYFFKAKLYLSWEGSIKKTREVIEEAIQNARGAEYPFIVNLLGKLLVRFYLHEESLAIDRQVEQHGQEENTAALKVLLLQAQINGLLGNDQLERSYYQSARNILESKITEHPEDPRIHGSLGIAYAGIGLREEAITEGLQGRWLDLVRIYCMVGDYGFAIDKLEVLLDFPGELSIPWINLDPVWDPLRDHPRFQKLLESDK